MNAVKHPCVAIYGTRSGSNFSRSAQIASKADLSAPSYTSLDRIGSSLRHCYGAQREEDAGCSDEWEEMLKKLS